VANPETSIGEYKAGKPNSAGGMYPLDLYAQHEGHILSFSAFYRKPVIFNNGGSSKGDTQSSGGSVLLHIPEGISANYGTNWNQKDLGIGAGAALDALSNSSGGSSSEIIASSLEGAGAEIIKQKLGSLANNSTGVDILNYAQRGVANSHPRLLFEGVGFRQFTFSYNFVPRNHAESLMVRQIIHYFKIHMHPTLTNAVLNYPAEFDIKYLDNEYLHNFKPCALTGMNVEYAVNGIWSAFQTTKAPTEVRMTLNFQETEFITRSDVERENV